MELARYCVHKLKIQPSKVLTWFPVCSSKFTDSGSEFKPFLDRTSNCTKTKVRSKYTSAHKGKADSDVENFHFLVPS